jgi:hypothetical protein
MAVLTGDMLRDCLGDLEGAVLETTDRRLIISRITWERCGCESSYDTYTVTIGFPDRPQLRLFLKDYGSFRQPKGDMEARRERELHVYRNILPAAGLDTAHYYGSVWNSPQRQFWLFLEFVEGTPLKFSDFAYWPQAAAWLGRLQGYCAQHPERLDTAGRLIEHDARFFLSAAVRALHVVRVLLPSEVDQLEWIVNRYDPLIELMSSQPRTLVHGAYRPEQILVDRNTQPPRLCPLDWEVAARGSSFYDLAFLADGFKPPRLGRVLDAYLEEAVKHGIRVPSRDDVVYLVNCFRLHRVFNWLGQAIEREYAERDVIKLTELAKVTAASLI